MKSKTEDLNLPNWDNYRFRASMIHKIMGQRGFGKTGESYLQEIWMERVFNRSKEIHSKYLDKGIYHEEKSITLYCKVKHQLGFKNDRHFIGEYFSGTPDYLHANKVIDFKTSWDYTTFPLFADKIDNKAYEYQGQVYMELTGYKVFELAYCLVDTPAGIVEREKSIAAYKAGVFGEIPADLDEEIELRMRYSDIPEELRVKTLYMEYDEALIRKMEERVTQAREYLGNLNIKYQNSLK